MLRQRRGICHSVNQQKNTFSPNAVDVGAAHFGTGHTFSGALEH